MNNSSNNEQKQPKEQNETNQVNCELNDPKSTMSKMNHDEYMIGIQQSIERYKLTNPEAYERNTKLGEYMMNQHYDLESGIDVKGDLLRCKSILRTIIDYDFDKDDLYDYEIHILNCILIKYLNCIDDIDLVFNNKDTAEMCLWKVLDKLDIYSNLH